MVDKIDTGAKEGTTESSSVVEKTTTPVSSDVKIDRTIGSTKKTTELGAQAEDFKSGSQMDLEQKLRTIDFLIDQHRSNNNEKGIVYLQNLKKNAVDLSTRQVLMGLMASELGLNDKDNVAAGLVYNPQAAGSAPGAGKAFSDMKEFIMSNAPEKPELMSVTPDRKEAIAAMAMQVMQNIGLVAAGADAGEVGLASAGLQTGINQGLAASLEKKAKINESVNKMFSEAKDNFLKQGVKFYEKYTDSLQKDEKTEIDRWMKFQLDRAKIQVKDNVNNLKKEKQKLEILKSTQGVLSKEQELRLKSVNTQLKAENIKLDNYNAVDKNNIYAADVMNRKWYQVASIALRKKQTSMNLSKKAIVPQWKYINDSVLTASNITDYTRWNQEQYNEASAKNTNLSKAVENTAAHIKTRELTDLMPNPTAKKAFEAFAVNLPRFILHMKKTGEVPTRISTKKGLQEFIVAGGWKKDSWRKNAGLVAQPKWVVDHAAVTLDGTREAIMGKISQDAKTSEAFKAAILKLLGKESL